MSTLYVHNFLTFSNNAVLQDVEFTVDITPSISICYCPISHLYVFYCRRSAEPSYYVLSDNEEVGSTGPYDDDGD